MVTTPAHQAEVVLQGVAGAGDLPGVGGAAQLPGQLVALGQSGGAEGGLGDQAAGRVDYPTTAVGGVLLISTSRCPSPSAANPSAS